MCVVKTAQHNNYKNKNNERGVGGERSGEKTNSAAATSRTDCVPETQSDDRDQSRLLKDNI